MLRALLIVACFVLLGSESRAELRIIAVKVTKVEKARPKVAIYSDVKTEDQRGLSIDEAAKILKATCTQNSRLYPFSAATRYASAIVG